MVGAVAVLSAGAGLTAFARQKEHELGSAIGHAVPKSVQKDPLYQIDMASFQHAVGSSFGFWLNGSKLLDAELVTVKDLTPAGFNGPVAPPKQAFQLNFQGPGTPLLGQGTYQLFGGGLPIFQLFVVPANPTASGTTYVAIVNRLYP